jgi:phage gpG-like protein
MRKRVAVIKEGKELTEAANELRIRLVRAWNKIDLGAICERIMLDTEKAHKRRFIQQRDPAGHPWRKLSPITIKRKGHSRILIETERLMESVTTRTSDSIRELIRQPRSARIRFGTKVPYAMVHQKGTRRVPRRRFIGFTKRQMKEHEKWIREEVMRAIKKEEENA